MTQCAECGKRWSRDPDNICCPNCGSKWTEGDEYMLGKLVWHGIKPEDRFNFIGMGQGDHQSI